MILSPLNCSVEMSPYERRGDFEQEGTKQIDDIQQIGERRYTHC